jgi:hypothetical protein
VGNQGDVVQTYDDYFILNSASPNVTYTVEVDPDGLGNYNLGMIIYNASYTPVYTDINAFDNSARLSILFSTASLTGPWYYRIFQLTPIATCGGTYHMTAGYASPQPTQTTTPSPTPTITPTPAPFACQDTADSFEPNNDFDTATTIGLGVKYDNLNFVQCVYDDGSWDNDFFKVRVKPGMLVTCKTSDLSPGTDTNLILWSSPGNGINGSDDVNRAAGDLSSSVTYYITYEGWLYGEVGQGFNVPQDQEKNYTYSYECSISDQSSPTPTPTDTPGPNVPTRTPIPTITPTPAPTLTPTPPFIRIQTLPTPTPPGLPTTLIPVSLQVYYDADNNNKPDPGEGVIGVSVRVYDLVSGQLLTQGVTDDTGRASFTVSAAGAVHLVVPYFNFSTIILPAGGSAVIRVSPSALPQFIP